MENEKYDKKQDGRDEKKKVEGVQYLKKVKLEDTNIQSPIQGPVLDEKPIFKFVRENRDSTIPKVWGIYLDERYMAAGIQPLAFGEPAHPAQFHTGTLFHFYAVFNAKRFIFLTTRPGDDPSPTEEDKRLIGTLQVQAQIMNNADFDNYMIASGDQYWSMKQHNGTACHCGAQDYIPKE